MAFTLSDDAMRRMREAIARFPTRRAGILHALWIVQEECSYVSIEAMELVAREVGISPAQVLEVVTFYTMFHLERPGRFVIQLCGTLSCELMGAGRLRERLCERLSVEPGGTTADGLFTLQNVECLAACGRAPAMQVNDVFYEDLTDESVDGILAACREGRPLPPPNEGVPGWPSKRS
jgi:NADH-quinone oxidoreductase subunit E